jgi:SAM-dependent methyltransferase
LLDSDPYPENQQTGDNVSYDDIDLSSLVTQGVSIREILNGSRHSGTLLTWIEGRKFIAGTIDRPGTILDIGCANGLLLRCLQGWCPYGLVPYGIDTDSSSIAEARKLFRAESGHFVNLPSQDLEKLDTYGLPLAYDFVYWNVGDNVLFNSSQDIDHLRSILNAVKQDGRLILGFYDKDLQVKEEKIKKLIQAQFNVQGRIGNTANTKLAIWIER